jgi:signal peptidase I
MIRLLLPPLTLVLVAGWMFTLRPVGLGGPAGFVMVSGRSMEPALESDDLVVTRKQQSYRTGDVVAFRVGDGLVIHRIVGGDSDSGFVMKGDNKGGADPWHPTDKDIIGKQWIHLPGKGRWLEWAREPQNLAALAGGMAAMTLVGGRQVTKKLRHRRGRHMRHNRVPGNDSFGGGPERLPAPLWAVGGLGVAGVAALTFLLLAYSAFTTKSERTAFEETGRYEQTGTFEYSIFTQPSTLYPQGLVGPVTAPPMVNGEPGAIEVPPVYTKLVKGIEVGYRYSAQGVQVAPGGGFAMNLSVKAMGEGGWSKSFELTTPSAIEGNETSGRAYIDLAPLQALIETIEKETGYTAGGYELVVTPKVEAKGTVAGEPVQLLFAPALTFEYTKTLITPDSNLQPLEPKVLGDNVTRSQSLSLGVLTLPVSTSRALFAGLVLASLGAGAAFASVVFLGVGQPETVKARVRYGATMVEVREADHNGSHRVQVASMTDLARLAQRDGGVIFSQKLPDGDLYFIPDGTLTYEYGPHSPPAGANGAGSNGSAAGEVAPKAVRRSGDDSGGKAESA